MHPIVGVEVRLNRIVMMRGCFSYVLDGYPLTKAQMVLMEQRNIIPVRIVELEIDARDCADRATADRYSKNR